MRACRRTGGWPSSGWWTLLPWRICNDGGGGRRDNGATGRIRSFMVLGSERPGRGDDLGTSIPTGSSTSLPAPTNKDGLSTEHESLPARKSNSIKLCYVVSHCHLWRPNHNSPPSAAVPANG